MIDGYMSNPMASQNQINRIPLATCADYAYNPKGYDPTRSIGQAILLQADTDARRSAAPGPRRNISRLHPLSRRDGHESSADRVSKADRRPQLLPRPQYAPSSAKTLPGDWSENSPIAIRRQKRRFETDIEWMKIC